MTSFNELYTKEKQNRPTIDQSRFIALSLLHQADPTAFMEGPIPVELAVAMRFEEMVDMLARKYPADQMPQTLWTKQKLIPIFSLGQRRLSQLLVDQFGSLSGNTFDKWKRKIEAYKGRILFDTRHNETNHHVGLNYFDSTDSITNPYFRIFGIEMSQPNGSILNGGIQIKPGMDSYYFYANSVGPTEYSLPSGLKLLPGESKRAEYSLDSGMRVLFP